MIISHKYRYVFVQTPRTGCTAIAAELERHYDGTPILDKHSNYAQFKRQASSQERAYFVFSGVRNPLDDVASYYAKLLSDHRGVHRDDTRTIEQGGHVSAKRRKTFDFVQREDTTFRDFLARYMTSYYTSNADLNRPYCDRFVRFESILDDFRSVLETLKIQPARELPVLNQTGQKKGYLEYYDEELLGRYLRRFLPFMEAWGYTPPAPFEDAKSTPYDRARYRLRVGLRDTYMRTFKEGPLRQLTFIRNRVEP